MDTKQFVVRVAWSQTDHENVLVDATNKDEAEQKVKDGFIGLGQILGTHEIHYIIEDQS